MERCVADPCCSTASLGVAQRAGCPQRPGRRPLQPLAAMPDRRSGSGLRAQRGSHLFEQPALATATEPVPSASLLGASRTTLIHTAGRKHSKLRVAVDVDEVLGRFLHSLNQFCKDAYNMHYDIPDYFVYDFAKVWKCSQDESNHKVHEFFTSDHFAEGIEVIPGSFESLARLRALCDLMVVTSRQHVIQEPTLEWIDRHYPEVFCEVHFGNHFALEGVSKKKSDICRSIGAEVLIDDNPSYAVECANAGIHVLLYDWEHGYPWSKTDNGPAHDLITRVRDWQEVEEVLGVLAATKQ